MPRLREHKKLLRTWLKSEDWKSHIDSIVDMDPKQATGPLLSFLLLGDEMTHRAALALGLCVNKMYLAKPEDARNIMRRLMWHMNEESGNIGWGIPQAFAEILVSSEKLAQEFHSILLSYIMDTGRDDNFCDHAILRRSCYWAVGRLTQVRPQLSQKAIPWLVNALNIQVEQDVLCRGFALWSLMQFPSKQLPHLEIYPILKRLNQSSEEELNSICTIFDDGKLQEYSIKELILTSSLL